MIDQKHFFIKRKDIWTLDFTLKTFGNYLLKDELYDCVQNIFLNCICIGPLFVRKKPSECVCIFIVRFSRVLTNKNRENMLEQLRKQI